MNSLVLETFLYQVGFSTIPTHLCHRTSSRKSLTGNVLEFGNTNYLLSLRFSMFHSTPSNCLIAGLMRQSGMTVRIRLHGLHRLDAVGGAMGAMGAMGVMGVMGVMGTGRVDHLRRLRGIRRRDILLDLTRKPCNPENATYKPKSQILMIRCLSSKSIINHHLRAIYLTSLEVSSVQASSFKCFTTFCTLSESTTAFQRHRQSGHPLSVG